MAQFLFLWWQMINLEQRQQEDTLYLGLRGMWVFDRVRTIRAQLLGVVPLGVWVVFDAQDAERLDITAAWLVYRQAQIWQQQGTKVRFEHFPAEYLGYFDATEKARPSGSSPDKGRLGRVSFFRLWQVLRSFITFFGHSLIALFSSLFVPHLFRGKSVLHHVFTTVSAPLPCFIGDYVAYHPPGAVLAMPGGDEIYTVDMVTISGTAELGVLLTAIMVAGRSGSAFAAEIGLMKTNQEVDALQVMGKDPFLILVVPRLVALVVALPLLTIVADIVALAAAALICSTILDISFIQFFTRIETNIELRTFAAGLIKAPSFRRGHCADRLLAGMRLQVLPPVSVNTPPRRWWMQSFVVLVLDALFSVLFYRLGF